MKATEVNKDDIGAIVSRMDAQMITMIELMTELHEKDVADFKDRYTEKYDNYAKKFRKEVIK